MAWGSRCHMGPHAYDAHLFFITLVTLRAHLYSVANLFFATKPSPPSATKE